MNNNNYKLFLIQPMEGRATSCSTLQVYVIICRPFSVRIPVILIQMDLKPYADPVSVYVLVIITSSADHLQRARRSSARSQSTFKHQHSI